MTRQERRTVLIFWLTIGLLLLGAFAAEAQYRNRICISALIVEAGSTVSTPVECT
jgi:hypothetical protein